MPSCLEQEGQYDASLAYLTLLYVRSVPFLYHLMSTVLPAFNFFLTKYVPRLWEDLYILKNTKRYKETQFLLKSMLCHFCIIWHQVAPTVLPIVTFFSQYVNIWRNMVYNEEKNLTKKHFRYVSTLSITVGENEKIRLVYIGCIC